MYVSVRSDDGTRSLGSRCRKASAATPSRRSPLRKSSRRGGVAARVMVSDGREGVACCGDTATIALRRALRSIYNDLAEPRDFVQREGTKLTDDEPVVDRFHTVRLAGQL